MDAVMPEVHQDTVDVLAAAGHRPRFADRHEGCCGALAEHAGLGSLARRQSKGLVAAFPGDAPIVVDSAGCGAHLKDLGRLGDDEARRLSARVVDLFELLADVVDDLPPSKGPRPRVVVQDPCHLRHVQRLHTAVRTVLDRYVDLVELDDDGRCCGAAGSFAMLRPDDAISIRAAKLDAIRRAGGGTVVSANPGCQLHLAAAGLDVVHPVSIVAAFLRGG
jgi:glycolate oxidase iron-sulfur subunit